MATAEKSASLTETYDVFFSFGPNVFKESFEKFSETAASFGETQKSIGDAAQTAANAWSKGAERLIVSQSDYVKSAYERGVSASKNIAASKSVQEAFDIQAEFTRETVDANFSNLRAASEMWLETLKSVTAPLTECYSDILEQAQSNRP